MQVCVPIFFKYEKCSSINFNFFKEIETLLSRCIMLGQFETAVDLCLSEQRYTDALLLAQLGGQELLYKTQKRYFEKIQTSTTKVYIKEFTSFK